MLKKIRLLWLAPSSSIEAMTEKFGDCSFLLNDHLENVTEFELRFCPAGKTNRKLRLADNFYLYQICVNSGILRFIITFMMVFFLTIKYKINVLRSSTPFHYALPLLLTAKILNRSFCVSIHADYDKREALQSGGVIPVVFRSNKLALILEKIVLKNADIILPIRESLKPYLLRRGVDENRIRIFPHSIDLSKFTKRGTTLLDKYEIGQNKKVLSVVGRIEKENYVYDYLSIAECLAEKREDWVMIIAGDGSELPGLKELVKEKALGEKVIFPGFIEHDLAIGLRQQSYMNLCLMAGFSLIEACAAGRPVISYDVEWHYELVQDEKTGFLLEEGEISELVKKILFLLSNPSLAKKMGDNARKLVYEKHSREKVTEIKRKIYRSLIN